MANRKPLRTIKLVDLRTLLREALILMLLIHYSACSKVKIEPVNASASAKILSSENKRPLGISVQTLPHDLTLGSQYLFIIFPFGSIHAEQATKAIFGHAYNLLAVRGFSPEQSNHINSPQLHIEVSDFSLNAYDLLFLRKISCEITLEAQVFRRGQMIKRNQDNTRYIRYFPFAFKTELSHVYNTCLQEAVNKMLNSVGLVAEA